MRGRGRPSFPDVLTPREWEVYYLLRMGLTNREIAGWLDISFHAAKFHVSEVLTKLAVERRSDLRRLDLAPARAVVCWRARRSRRRFLPVASGRVRAGRRLLALGGLLLAALTFLSMFLSDGRFPYLLPVLAALTAAGLGIAAAVGVRLVAPHPRPLPGGEGNARADRP